MLNLSGPNIWLLLQHAVLPELPAPNQEEGAQESAWKWRGRMEPNLFPVVLLSVTREQKGFVLAVEKDVEPR